MDARAWYKKMYQEARDEDPNPFLERFNAVPVPKKRSSKARRSINKSIFHPFPRLPAEIRANIWAIALEDRIYRPEKHHRVIPPLNTVFVSQFGTKVWVKTSRRYPALFFVNREARYEAARADGGKWYPLGTSAIEIYANPKKEFVFICDFYTGPRHTSFHQIAQRYNADIYLDDPSTWFEDSDLEEDLDLEEDSDSEDF
ncbi:uncharacterized protein J4E87_007081 [Alternaria ethzedia]|uniref:uncharacterized protein n=1 Tax=Alternaria ethzedia TaxID=181014 RepID=UPI0020C39BFA|nr:uncharacterized protein J4E87_007081 [Alternaria ethzedia]KAI4620753.1 hypothetical protein J4E87_007081 [Alternaria ethzedia]